jgi:hypothetical protein
LKIVIPSPNTSLVPTTVSFYKARFISSCYPTGGVYKTPATGEEALPSCGYMPSYIETQYFAGGAMPAIGWSASVGASVNHYMQIK